MPAQLRKSAVVFAITLFLALLAGCAGMSGSNQVANPTPTPPGGSPGGGGSGNSTPAASKFVYIVGGERGAQSLFLVGFTINQQTGELTSIPGRVNETELGFEMLRSPLDYSFYTFGNKPDGTLGLSVYTPGSSGLPQLTSFQSKINPSAITPDGKFLFDEELDGIHVFAISGVSFTEISGSPFHGSQRVGDFVVTTNGKFLFALAGGDSNTAPDSRVHVFSIASNGALSEVSVSAPLASNSVYTDIHADTTGHFVYTREIPHVIDARFKPLIHVFSVDQSSGAISEVPGSPFPFVSTARLPFSLDVRTAVGPNNVLYAIQMNEQQISAFMLNTPNGVPVFAGAFKIEDFPRVMAFDRNGRFAYVLQEDLANTRNLLTTYTLGPNGALTPIAAPPAQALCCTGIGLQVMTAD